jgi:hypothetical protein
MLSGMSGRRHLRLVLATATVALTATSVASVQANAAPQVGSGKSEAVIVLMRAQHPDLKPKIDAVARSRAVNADQAGIVSDLHNSGATHIQQLDTVSAVAATASQSEISRLQANPAVADVVPDRIISVPSTAGVMAHATEQPGGRAACTADPSKPQIEPEALGLTNTDKAQAIATGKGVKVAFMADGIDINNPDFIRPDGTPVFSDYQDFSGDGKNDASGGAEAFGDASSIAAQGNTTFDLSTALPNAGLPAGCTFRIKGFAPGASLVGIKVFGEFGAPESAFVRGIDYAVNVDKVDVINQSFGATLFPDGAVDPIALADEAAIAAGVTVVASSGDSGQSGTVGTPSSAPDVIAAAGTTAFRLDAQDKGYSGFVSNNISGLSSGGPTLDNKYVDIVAPSQSAMTDCTVGAPWPECTQNSESFGGTSESSPFIAGAAALVIQAYEDSHHGVRPTPALVKQLLLGTATDLDVPSDQQGAGLLNSLAAVQAARAIGTGAGGSSALVPSSTQFDITGASGTTQHATETLTNTSGKAQTVTGTSRTLGSSIFQVNKTVQVTGATPPPANPPGGPGEAAQAAPSFTFTVPKNVPFMTAEMIWPGTRTSGQLDLELFDPHGNFVGESYDFGFTDFQHISVHNPTPGTWTEKILWNNGRDHFQETLDAPGTFRGAVTLQNTGFRYVSAGTNTVTKTIPAGGSAKFAFTVPLPKAAGDAPASLQFDSNRGTHLSVPLARRVLIPTTGNGRFTTTITGGVGRGLNQYLSYFMDVPKGKQDMTLNFTTIDPATSVGFLLVSPTGQVLSGDTNAVETAWNTGDAVSTDAAEMTVNQPASGRWEVIAFLESPSSGTEFSQTVHGQVQFNTVHAQANGLPGSAHTTLTGAVQATVKVRNTSSAGEFFFLDPRLNKQADVTLPPIAGQSNIDLPEDTADTSPPVYNVPTHTTTLTQHFSSTVPADDYLEFGDGNPGPYLFAGTSGVNTISDADQLAFGPWFTDVGEVGPFPDTAPAGTANLSLTAHMQPFDGAVTSGTGDFWQTAVGGDAGNAVFIPAGGTATIPVTITPTAKSGTIVQGTLYVDTWNNLFGQGSELAGIPYSYTAG